ncbi:DUF4097 family beta strand repeat protein [Algoriphagus lutimaris]|uniref:DUF4097 family beta strand repeat-containing protein n=1 Tax=Algoriphagus lutimaris TaxID=613197 RepID=UPI00196B5A9A|nr:DUF4097 family beta strand repeat-containing protein [Algoriphagus lutimaris]MBN3519440.1 DUF4097 family beta strand repeat protein [Algoriphagus lutimaris]
MNLIKNYIKIYYTFSILLALALLSSCSKDLEVVQSINQEFEGVEEVEIESGFLEVVYTGDPSLTSVSLSAMLESTNAGRYKIEYREESGKLIIELDQKRVSNSGRDRGFIHLIGPERMGMNVEVGSGSATISNVETEVFDVMAGSGRLNIQNINSSLANLTAGSGEVNVINLQGKTTVEVGSGIVEMKNIVGDVNLSGSSGKYQLNRIEGMVHAILSSGTIDLTDVESLGKLEVSSGRINAINSGLSNESLFKASSGNIKIQTFSNLIDYNYNLATSSGRVSVGDSSSSGTLKIDNGSPYTVSGTVSSGIIEIRN